MSADDVLAVGELARVRDEHDPCWGMTGRASYVNADWIVLDMTAWHTTRGFLPSQLARVRPLPAQASGERAA